MRRMRLYKYIFASIFGGRSAHLVRSAGIRAAAMLAIAASLGILMASVVPSIPAKSQDTLAITCMSMLFVQLAALLVYGSSFGILRPHNRDRIGRLLMTLPLKSSQVWMVTLLPGLFLGLIVLGFTVPILLQLFLTIHWWLLCSAGALGVLSALGLIYAIPRRYSHLQIIGVPLYYLMEYKLVGFMNSAPANLRLLLASVLLFINVLMVGLLFASSQSVQRDITRGRIHRRTWFLLLPTQWWFAKKALRSSITCTSLITAFVISLCLSLAAWRMDVVDRPLLGSVIAFLVAAFCSDIRVISRRLQPPESVMIRGTPRFFSNQLGWGIGFSSLAVTPLVALVVLSSVNSTDKGALLIPLVLGIGAGTFAGIWIAPGSRDITAQICANLLAIGLVAIPLTIFQSLSMDNIASIAQLLTASVLLLASFAIELRRNNYIWRKVRAV
jgi:hypothetical protein